MVEHKLIKQDGNSQGNCMKFLQTYAEACELVAKSASLFIYLLFGIEWTRKAK